MLTPVANTNLRLELDVTDEKQPDPNDAAPAPAQTAVAGDIPVPKLDVRAPTGEIPPLTGDLSVEPTYTSKRKRGRKAAAQQEQPEQAVAAPIVPMTDQQREAIGAAIGEGLGVIFTVVAATRGDHWKLDADTQKRLGVLWGVALEPWLATSGKYVPLAVAALATAGVVMPRVQLDAQRAKELQAGGAAERIEVVR